MKEERFVPVECLPLYRFFDGRRSVSMAPEGFFIKVGTKKKWRIFRLEFRGLVPVTQPWDYPEVGELVKLDGISCR